MVAVLGWGAGSGGQLELGRPVGGVVGGPRALGLVGIGSGGEGGVTEVKGLLTLTGRCP